MSKFGPKPKALDIAQVESIAAMGGTNEQIAQALGISATTLKARRRQDRAIDEAVQRGKDKADLQVVAALYKKAMGGDTTACIFWLKNRRPMEWRDRHDMEHSGEMKISARLTMSALKKSLKGCRDGSGS